MKIHELPLGARVVLGSMQGHTPFDDPTEITWLKVSSRNDFMSEQRVIECRYDSPEPTNSNRGRRSNGNNYFPHSNLLQYLNGRGDRWWAPAHRDDAPPYSFGNNPGFLTMFGEDEIACMMDRAVTVVSPAGSKRQFGKSTQLVAKVLLPALSELVPSLTERTEGELFELFERDAPHFNGSIFTRTGCPEISCDVYKWRNGRCGTEHACSWGNVHPVIRLQPETELAFDGEVFRLGTDKAQKESYLKSLQAILCAR